MTNIYICQNIAVNVDETVHCSMMAVQYHVGMNCGIIIVTVV